MIKQASNIFRKRFFKNFTNGLFNHTSQPRSKLQFSTICNKQFNETDKWKTFDQLSKEEFKNYVDSLNTTISATLTKDSHFDLLVESMLNYRIQHPNEALPIQMLKALLEGVYHYNLFIPTVSSILEHDKKHQVIENIEEMNNVYISKVLKLSHLHGMLFKAILQEWFNLEELKSLMPQFNMGINVEGKDIVLHDQVSYYYGLCELILTKLLDSTEEPTRETLVGLVSIICFKFPIMDQEKDLFKYIKKFIEIYPIVKQRYTTPYSGDSKQSWANALGKVYSEDEFEWYLDIETDLPIHLGGFYNICIESLNVVVNSKTPERLERFLHVWKKESLRAPNNPYIPFIKFCITNEKSEVDKVLKILANSNPQSRLEDLKRIELFGIFTNQKPSQPRIKDLKFFPLLLVKIKSRDGDSTSMLEQVEYYSRIPSHAHLIIAKFENSLKDGKLEQALQNYQCLSFFEQGLPPDLIFYLTNLAALPMIQMGYHNECIQVIERFKTKFGYSNWGELLERVKKEIEKTK